MSVSLHPDFLTFTYPASSLAEGVGVVTDYLDLVGGDFSIEQKKDSFILNSDCGLLCTFKSIEQSLKCRIELGGYYFRRLSNPIDALSLVFQVKDYNITRFDIALDDFSRRVTPEEVYNYCQQGNFKLFRSYQLQQSSLRDGSPASTLYLGKLGKCEKLLRVYDAAVIHDINAIRWELQLRRDRASLACDAVVLSSKPYQQMASFLTGSVDFGLFDGCNISRDFKRFGWWQSLIDDCQSQPEKIKLPNDNPSLERMITWLRDQCSPSLGVLLRGLGVHDFSKFVLEASTSRMRQHHYLLVQNLLDLKKDGINLI